MNRSSFLIALALIAAFAAAPLYARHIKDLGLPYNPTPMLARGWEHSEPVPERCVERNFRAQFALRQSYRLSVLRMFYPLSSVDAPEREYPEEDRLYVAEKGRLTEEQVAAIRRIADSRLWFHIQTLNAQPIKFYDIAPLSDADKDAIAQTFDISREDLDMRLDLLNTQVAGYDSSIKLLPYAAPEPEEPLDGGALMKALEELTGEDASVKRCGCVMALPEGSRGSAFGYVLKNKPELFDVNERAFALLTYADHSLTKVNLDPDTAAIYSELETTVDHVLATSPNSWKLALAAVKIIKKLPKTYISVEGEEPRRCVPKETPEIVYLGKTQGVDLGRPDAKYLYSYTQDRIRILQILERAAQNACEELFNPSSAEPGYFESQKKNSIADFFTFFSIEFCDTLVLRGIKDFGPGSEPLKDSKTDFQAALPALTEEITTDPFSLLPQVMGYSDSTTWFKEYIRRVPEKLLGGVENYDDVTNDEERLIWLLYWQHLSSLSLESPNTCDAYACRARVAQNSLGVHNALHAVMRKLKDPKTVPDPSELEIGPEPLPLRSPEDYYSVLQAISNLSESETILLSSKSNDNGMYSAQVSPTAKENVTGARRFPLSGNADFFGLYRKSLDLKENYLALAGLAQEYQARGKYDKAKEYWTRAKKRAEEDLAQVDAEKEAPKAAALAKNVDVCQENLTRLENLRLDATFFIFEGSYALGMNASLLVLNSGQGEVEFTARRLDLAPELVKLYEPQPQDPNRTRDNDPSTFPLVVRKDAVDGNTRFTDEPPIQWTEKFENAYEIRRVVPPIAEPGAYIVELSIDGKACARPEARALLFMRRHLVVSEKNPDPKKNDGKPASIQFVDSTTGKPVPELKLEVVSLRRFPKNDLAFHITSGKDGRILKTEIDAGGFPVAILQPDDPAKADIAVEVFDRRNSQEFLDGEYKIALSAAEAKPEENIQIRIECPEASVPYLGYFTLYDPEKADTIKELREFAKTRDLPFDAVILGAASNQAFIQIPPKEVQYPDPPKYGKYPIYHDALPGVINNHALKSSIDEYSALWNWGNDNKTHYTAKIPKIRYQGLFPKNAINKTVQPNEEKALVCKFKAPQKPGVYKIAFLADNNYAVYLETELIVTE